MNNKCESCGVEFYRHLGVIGTCAKLKEAEKKIMDASIKLAGFGSCKSINESHNLACEVLDILRLDDE